MEDEFIQYYDISPEISEETIVWPGDVKFSRNHSVDFKNGGNFLLSSIHTTLHIGAHTDAPNHYHPEGEGIHTRDLNFYFGLCQVISLSRPPNSRIYPSDLSGIHISAKRILFKTNSFLNPRMWNNNFVSLSAELVFFLATHGVVLLGIDTPSVDLSDDKRLEAHQAIFQNNMAILEGIILSDVPDGVYTLVALPLKIKDADASPVRAILIK